MGATSPGDRDGDCKKGEEGGEEKGIEEGGPLK